MTRRLSLLLGICFLSLTQAADFYPELEVSGKTYYKVFVLSANESSLSIKHSGGIAQLALADMPDEVKLKYGYDSLEDAERSKKLKQIRYQQVLDAEGRLEQQARIARENRKKFSEKKTPLGMDEAFASFGQPPELLKEVDLRGLFRSHNINVRRQRGPSCSVHAVVAALEFQFAEKHGKRVNFSEPFLVEATSRTLGKALVNTNANEAVTQDEGFALEHVFQAIRGYGLVLETSSQSMTPESFNEEFGDIHFAPFLVPGGNSRAGIGNLAHALNAGMPVVVGVQWPAQSRVERTSLLSEQPPAEGAGHAVTIVGYRCPTGNLEDAKFIFRNSWGADWGAGGYGFFTYEYLSKNLTSAYVVELR